MKIRHVAIAMVAGLMLVPLGNVNAEIAGGAANIRSQAKNFTPIEKAACGPYAGRWCGPWHHRVCGPYGRCWCARC